MFSESEMVERIAKAICKSRTCEGANCCQWPAQGGRLHCPVKQGGYDDAARAAFEAVAEELQRALGWTPVRVGVDSSKRQKGIVDAGATS